MRDDAVDLWALDEVHFQQQGSRCRMWVPPETKDPVVYHHPRARASDTSRPYDCETVSSCFVARAEDSMARASGNSSRCFERPARSPVAACWLLTTTPNIIAPNCTWNGASSRSPNSVWTSCRLTAPN